MCFGAIRLKSQSAEKEPFRAIWRSPLREKGEANLSAKTPTLIAKAKFNIPGKGAPLWYFLQLHLTNSNFKLKSIF